MLRPEIILQNLGVLDVEEIPHREDIRNNAPLVSSAQQLTADAAPLIRARWPIGPGASFLRAVAFRLRIRPKGSLCLTPPCKPSPWTILGRPRSRWVFARSPRSVSSGASNCAR